MINKNKHLMLPVSGQSAAKMTFFRLAGLMLVIAAVLISPSICSASVTNVYIAQNASGAANGADCADALPLTWVNNTSNWGSGANQVGPGSTVHLCGTFTGAAGGQVMLIKGSGANGNPITIFFEPGANLTSPAWNQFGAIQVSSASWIVIDGGSNGTIQNTANGTGLGFAQMSEGVGVYGSSNVTVKNLTVANMCQHTSVNDTVGCNTSGTDDAGVRIQSGATNITITRNTIHDAFVGVSWIWQNGDSNITVSNNTISRTNWGVNTGGAGTASGFTLTNNDITCVVGGNCNWTDTGNDFHHNGIIIDPINSTINNVVISNNYFHDINTCTAGIFLDTDLTTGGAGDAPNALIYNNVFYTTPGQIGPSDGWITSNANGTIIVNNTITGASQSGVNGGGSGFIGPTIKNNIMLSIASYGIVLDPGFNSVTSDFNSYFGLSPSNGMAAEPTFYNTVASWVTGTGFDTHSITSNPNLTASFRLNSGSSVIGRGANLTSLGVAGLNISAPQTFGVNGSCGTGCLPRPASGAWDIGAYQSGVASVGVNPASGLAVTAAH